MTGPRRRWAHAARVALGATAVVAVLALGVALVANLVIVQRLDRDVDTRLTAQLAQAASGASAPLQIVPGADRDGDLDDAPIFIWHVDAAGKGDGTDRGRTLRPPLRLVDGERDIADRREYVPIHDRTVGGGLAGGRRERGQDRPDP